MFFVIFYRILLQVTIDSTNDAHMPRGRYFHAAEISPTRKEIYVHGGLTSAEAEEGTIQNTTLNDFWKFHLKARHWIEIEVCFVVIKPFKVDLRYIHISVSSIDSLETYIFQLFKNLPWFNFKWGIPFNFQSSVYSKTSTYLKIHR